MVRVLIVDDHAPFLRAARAVVAAVQGFEVVGEARSGEEALLLVDATEPDLVLMDVVMDGIGGIEATRQITELHPSTRTVLVSSYGADELDDAIHECGAVAFLAKRELSTRALADVWSATG